MEDDGVIEIEDDGEDEYEDEDEESEEDEDSYDSSEEEELISSAVTSPRVSNSVDDMNSCKRMLDYEEELEIDGLNCPICTEAWTNSGEHQICCLPCGHIYGLSCIKKWIRQSARSRKCPQCNRTSALKDVRLLYAERLCVVDAVLLKQVRSLEAKCASLEKKNAVYIKKEVESKKREADFDLKLQKLTEKAKYLESLIENKQNVVNEVHNVSGSQVSSGIFTLQREFQVDGGRYFDIDASGQLMIVARRLYGMGGTNLVTKISLVAPNEREDIQLPANSKAVMGLCVRPCTRLALLASLGKKLSVISTESNNTVLTYDLPAPAWSCSWDIDSSHHVYTGLQNGMVFAFDIRQTRAPLEQRNGLSSNPVHTVISVATTTLLTASQIGICEWNIGSNQQRPYLIPESEKQGVCISLAHSANDIVATFRPKVETVQSPISSSSVVNGCHIFYKKNGPGPASYLKTGSLLAQVDSIRLPKSTIVNKQHNGHPMFVCANEGLVVHDVSKVAVVGNIKTTNNRIQDVRCANIWNSCVLGCLSGDVVQLFT